MNIFRNFMIGRYGIDQLTVAMLVLGMFLTFLGDIFNSLTIIRLTYLIFIACVYRYMSRNIIARQKENNRFLQYWDPIKSWGISSYNKFKLRKDYKYFKCPNCKQQLRVPKGKGKIAVTCKKCQTKFIQRS